MNIKQFIFSATGAGILTGAIYFTQGQGYRHEGVKVLVSDTVKRTQETISPFGDPKVYGETVETITNRDIQDFLDKNPILKMRIQNMSWYRDFLSGNLNQEVYSQYIQDAHNIEATLVDNPGLFEKIQYEIWWQRYLRGDTNPVDMFAGNITSLLRLQDLEKNNPDLYQKMQKNPNWNRGIQYGENYIVVGQTDIIDSATLRLEQLKTEPGLRAELTRFGFSEEDLYTDDWSTGQGFYSAIDVIRRIQTTDPERLEWFYGTDLGQQYRDGTITEWRQLEEFLER